MRVKLITLRYSATLGGFDDTPLTECTRDRELLEFREHFFTVSDVPHLACVLLLQDVIVDAADLAQAKALRATEPADADDAWSPPAEPAPRKRGSAKRRTAPDPTTGLSEPDRALFNTLREWRTATAREEGVPPFLVFTNRHLLELVARRPETPTALLHLDGIGPGKVKRYGKALLGVLHGRAAGTASGADAAAAATTETAAEAAAGPDPASNAPVEEASP